MKDKPIIGIIGKVMPNTKVNDEWHRNYIYDEHRYYVVKHGGIAISILPTEPTLIFNQNNGIDKTKLNKKEIEDLYKQIELCDGFILQGGLTDCKYEIEIAKKIIELDKPLIGICAGFNNILRAIGIEVVFGDKAIHDHNDEYYRHAIVIQKKTKLYSIIKKEQINVNSYHERVATKEMLNDRVKISSFAQDGTVESYELNDKRFILGIKWHPEILHEEYVDTLYKKLILESKK